MLGMSVSDRLQLIKQRIEKACARSGRSPSSVHLLAVSKLQPMHAIDEALAAGQMDFAENYAQEAELKQEQIINPRVRWHFIGRIQSNKVKMLAKKFSVLHSVDRFSIAHHLNQLSEGIRQDIFIQYNVAEESTKGGASELELENLVRGVSACPNLQILGLMVMPPLGIAAEEARPYFRAARETMDRLRSALSKDLEQHAFNQLSMGTSHDFEIAIEEGATWIRVGTDVFGPRETNDFEKEFQ